VFYSPQRRNFIWEMLFRTATILTELLGQQYLYLYYSLWARRTATRRKPTAILNVWELEMWWELLAYCTMSLSRIVVRILPQDDDFHLWDGAHVRPCPDLVFRWVYHVRRPLGHKELAQLKANDTGEATLGATVPPRMSCVQCSLICDKVVEHDYVHNSWHYRSPRSHTVWWLHKCL
jgi:hypothetical protein